MVLDLIRLLWVNPTQDTDRSTEHSRTKWVLQKPAQLTTLHADTVTFPPDNGQELKTVLLYKSGAVLQDFGSHMVPMQGTLPDLSREFKDRKLVLREMVRN
jgi:hypothetical protein